MRTLLETLQYFLFISVELLLLFTLINMLVELLLIYVPMDKIQSKLSNKGILGSVLGATLGSLTPFCSCSTIPMMVGFLKAKVPFGSAISFLIASPILNPIIIGLLITLIDVQAAIIYFIIGFFSSVCFGFILEKMGAVKYVKKAYNGSNNCCEKPSKPNSSTMVTNNSNSCCEKTSKPNSSTMVTNNSNSCCEKPSKPNSSTMVTNNSNSCCEKTSKPNSSSLITNRNSFGKNLIISFKCSLTNLKPILVYMFVGVALGSVIHGYLPSELVVSLAGENNPFAVPVAAITGIPLYIRAETALPIGMSLLDKGMSIGAVIALIIGGAGMAIPEMMILAGIFKKRMVLILISIIFTTAVVAGYLFNLFY